MLYEVAPLTASHEIVAWLSPAAARMLPGARGGGVAEGVAVFSADMPLSPAEFTAVTTK